MSLSKISLFCGLMIPVFASAHKKPRSLCACKLEVVAATHPREFSPLADSLLVRIWDIDSSSGLDTRWEIRYSGRTWTQQCDEYGCEKQIVKRKILFFFPQTKVAYEPYHRIRTFSFQQPILHVLSQVDSLSKLIPISYPQGQHLIRFEYITAEFNHSFMIDFTDKIPALASLVSIFERDAILLNDK